MSLFASLVIDRAPLQWEEMPTALLAWLQNAGGVAAFGVALVLLASALSRDTQESPLWNLTVALRPLRFVLLFACSVAGIGYALLLLVWIGGLFKIPNVRFLLPRPSPFYALTIGDYILAGCGAIGLFVAVMPIAFDAVTRLSWGRIGAIARLSWKEAVRGRVVWVFGAMALVFLFADWFVTYKPENQLRNYVRVVYWSMTPLFLLTAGLLGSFSIPNDVKNNSIHTIVTKPVEKFEIVLGRFFGYAALLTVGLGVVSLFSLIYLIRGVNEEATRESYRARVPVYGHLHFHGTKSAREGDNVGREWTHRTYITGPTLRQRDPVRQYAIWDFPEVPADVLGRKDPMLFEYAFDIFRLSKGIEGKGMNCTFAFAEGAFPPERLEVLSNQLKVERSNRVAQATKDLEPFQREVDKIEQAHKDNRSERIRLVQEAADKLKDKRDPRFAEFIASIGTRLADAKTPGDRQAILTALTDHAVHVVDRALAAEHRVYFARNLEVTDQHTQDFIVPPGVLEALGAGKAAKERDDPDTPAMRVLVSVDVAREQQMLGVAQQDFYLVAHEMPFWQNFLKGILGMWCTHMLVLGVAVAFSTYLSSVISFLGTMFLYLTGLNMDYLREVAEKRVDGGGPAESLIRLTRGMPIAAKLDESPTKSLVDLTDDLFSWWIGRILNMIPDVSRHDLHQYVANGFDIGWLDVLFLDNALPLLGYLAPWAIVAYYLMKYREIANPQ